MTAALAARRVAVMFGLIAAIAVAVGTVAAASRWTAAEAPLAVAPVSITSVQAALDRERSRSAALQDQLASLEGASGDLSAALRTAQQQLAADGATAAQLRAALTAAQTKLTKLEAALQAAAKARTTTVVSTPTSSSSTGGRVSEGGGGDD